MTNPPPPSPLRSRVPSAAGLGLALLALTVMPTGAAEEPQVSIRTVQIPGFGALRFPAPTAWSVGNVQTLASVPADAEGAAERSASFQVFPEGAAKSEMNVTFSWTDMPDPAFNGPGALRSLVDRMGRAALDESIEARYTLRELRSPSGGGYCFTLRARSPRKKSQAYLTSGAFGLGNALVRFTFLAPQPDLPEAAEALNLITGVRIDDETAAAP